MKLPFLKEAVRNVTSKPSTVLFPAVPVEAKPNYRGRIAYDAEKCVNCGSCIKVCSPGAITREYEDVPEGQKITYTFDLTSCTFCAMCQDFCGEGAIRLTEDYHMVAEDAKELRTVGSRVKEKPKGVLTVDAAGCIYCGLCARNCPSNALTVDRKTKSWAVDKDKCVQCGICIGKCPKKVLSFAEPAPEGVLQDPEKCIYCTICAKKCPNGALVVDRKEKRWEIDREKCVECGICLKACPKDALKMGPVQE